MSLTYVMRVERVEQLAAVNIDLQGLSGVMFVL
jgi:hypothetical protein